MDEIHVLKNILQKLTCCSQNLEYRLKSATPFFRVARDKMTGLVVAYVCGTCSTAEKLQHESMFEHEPHGGLLCLHSVTTEASWRRKGLATALLRNYVDHILSTQPQIKKIALLTKFKSGGLYRECGFAMEGPSEVQHGQEQWYEMSLSRK
eukprot:TRINITY_DN1244_c0_g1_i1.p1 TRINITY_DN1244_c0_g1~~TRINITY_DN1244_c0_g1_i1.p1  ORF type:complete len:151 (+),score=3.58 TRINITY_DN1244_c0_g1_i1:172-624(+)